MSGTFIKPQHSETFALIFKSGLSSGGSYAFTTYYVRSTTNMTIDSQVYTSCAAMDFKMKEGFNGTVKSEDFEITIPADKMPIAARILGQHPEIEVEVYQVDFSNPSSITKTLRTSGIIKEINWRARGKANLAVCTFTKHKSVLENHVLGVTATNYCTWMFGDDNCKAVKHTFAGTVTNVNGFAITVDISAAPDSGGIAPTIAALDLDFFNQGYVSKDNLNLPIRSVSSTDASALVLNLYEAAPTNANYTWAGQAVTVHEGCSKIRVVCQKKINSTDDVVNNIEHFGGFGIAMPEFNPSQESEPIVVGFQGLQRSVTTPISVNIKKRPFMDAQIVLEWTPESLNNPIVSALAGWYQADVITGLSDGAAVTSWSDSSGQGNTLTQSSSGAQPSYETNELNSLPIVRFDKDADSGDNMLNADMGGDFDVGTGDFFLAMVAKFSTASGNQFVMSKAFGTRGLNIFLNSSGTLFFRPQTQGVTTNNIQQTGATDGQFHVIVCRRVSGVITGTYDGQAFTTDNGSKVNNGSIDNDNDFRIGSSSTGGLDTDMDLAETLLGTGLLSDLNRKKLEGYLAHKWGLKANLPSDHTYRFRPPQS